MATVTLHLESLDQLTAIFKGDHGKYILRIDRASWSSMNRPDYIEVDMTPKRFEYA